MSPHSILIPALLATLLATGCTTMAPSVADIGVGKGTAWIKQCHPDDAWDKAGPPFRIHGGTYYVGTCGITAVLVTGNAGHVLIDGGPRNGGPLIAANVAALGFRMADVKILLHTHEHFDHVGGLAYLQQQSRARVIASRLAAPVLASGMTSDDDPQAGMHGPFEPVAVSETIADGGKVTLGDIELTAIETPGHTPGALSWSWRECEGNDCQTIVYMDSLSPMSSKSYRFSDHPAYVARYKLSLAALATIPCDIALTPHPAASVMFERIASEVGLIDSRECRLYADDIAVALEQRLEKEGQQPATP
jgi:metallo-beta-lactamase class B